MKTPEQFMEYYRSNYPSRTIISNPDWHAPKLYRAAIQASAHEELLEACQLTLKHLIELMETGIRITAPNSPEAEAIGLIADLLRSAIARAEAQ